MERDRSGVERFFAAVEAISANPTPANVARYLDASDRLEEARAAAAPIAGGRLDALARAGEPR
jgi:hypothetical protein